MTNNRNTNIPFMLLVFAALAVAGCSGGGSVNNPPRPPQQQERTGIISGVIESDTGDYGTGRHAGARQTLAAVANARVYAFPGDTALANLQPDTAMPHAVSQSDGTFTIRNVPEGKATLVIDINADGVADDRVFDIQVSSGISTLMGKVPVASSTADMMGSWCNVSLGSKLDYVSGDTLAMSMKGYNYGSTALKCGIKIVLRKGTNYSEIWHSDFSTAAEFISMAANSVGTGTLQKVIPVAWEPTSSETDSNYQLYAIRENGTIWGKSSNFNMQCPSACTSNAACDDGDPLTLDVCGNIGTCRASCSHYCSDSKVTNDYFPLAVGNSWTYKQINPLGPPTSTVTGCKMINGKEYYELSNCMPNPGNDTIHDDICYLRVDANSPNLIYTPRGTDEVLFIDTGDNPDSAKNGNSAPIYVYRGAQAFSSSSTVIDNDRIVKAPLGTFTDCKGYESEIRCCDTGYNFWVCKNIGPAELWGNTYGGRSTYLIKEFHYEGMKP